MIEPKLMCRQHLLGEHFEIHKAVGNLRHSATWTNSLTKKGFLEPRSFVKRHNKLAKEMLNRNMKHRSELNVVGIKLPIGKIDVNKSIEDLKKRCVNCRERLR